MKFAASTSLPMKSPPLQCHELPDEPIQTVHPLALQSYMVNLTTKEPPPINIEPKSLDVVMVEEDSSLTNSKEAIVSNDTFDSDNSSSYSESIFVVKSLMACCMKKRINLLLRLQKQLHLE